MGSRPVRPPRAPCNPRGGTLQDPIPRLRRTINPRISTVAEDRMHGVHLVRRNRVVITASRSNVSLIPKNLKAKPADVIRSAGFVVQSMISKAIL